VNVLQPGGAELLLRPLLGRAHLRRIRHAAADAIGEVRGGLRQLAVVQLFVDDPGDHRVVDLSRARGRECERQDRQNVAHCRLDGLEGRASIAPSRIARSAQEAVGGHLRRAAASACRVAASPTVAGARFAE